MGGENRLWKWLVVLALTALAILVLYPPKDKLKPGIDLAGGTSLIYEIDMTGMASGERANLAERVMNVLKARVDPNSQFNLVWRPIGNNRLEIQMPRPPKEARARRAAYEGAREKVREMNVTKTDIEQALAVPAEEREAAFGRLVRGVTPRKERLTSVGEAWDAYLEVRDTGNLGAEIEAQQEYEKSLEKVLATNVSIGRLTDMLALKGVERTKELDRLKSESPAYASLVDESLAAYDGWSDKRGSLEDPADLKRAVRGAGVLEFRVLAARSASSPQMLDHPTDPTLREEAAKYEDQLDKRGPRPRAGDRYQWFEIADYLKFLHAATQEEAEANMGRSNTVVKRYAGKYYVLSHVDEGDQKYGLTRRSPKWALKRASPSRDPGTGKPCVDFQLDPRGGLQFAKVTRLNKNRELAIFLDDLATSHATIISEIHQRGQITGNFTHDQVMDLVRRLEAGSLPARLKETPLQEKSTGPMLGERNRDMGMRAAVYGLSTVIIFMLVYYLFLGVLADLALLLNLLFVLAVMAALEATFTLPGIAGLILTVGMAVDANVLIYERIREELARGVALKKSAKTGYEKAFSTIVDANLTTLITCVILGYVGSEEVRGFAMTLGFGVLTSMFTSLFVTRLILMTLIEKRIVQRLPMLRIIGRPNVDWIGLRRVFWPVSIVAVVTGLSFFVFVGATDKEKILDIELLGGTSVQIQLADGVEMNAEEVRAVVTGKGGNDAATAAGWLRKAAEAMRVADIQPGQITGEFVMTSSELTAPEMNDVLRTTFERSLALGGFSGSGPTARFVTKPQVVDAPTPENDQATKEVEVDLDSFRNGVMEAADYADKAAARLEGARIQTVADIGVSASEPSAFEVITVEPNKELVRAAILGVMGDRLDVERAVGYTMFKDAERAPDGLFPIQEETTFLGEVIGDDAPNDIRAYKGGVALVFDELTPPQTIAETDRRFREMRLQPQFEQYESREYAIYGLTEAEAGGEEGPLYSRIAVVVVDENLIYGDDPVLWREQLAVPELQQAEEAFSSEKTLRKVVQFAPQIASQTQQQALISLVLALGAIVAYVWIRFGTMQYGLAAIVCLVHDVAITLGVITLADIAGLGDLRIDLAMIAALLTVVGYSLNDTIVVFDRIRENRGKLSKLSVGIINTSINMTLSRSILTSGTTLIAVGFMFFLGGPGVHGFSFALLCGVLVGTYSSVGIAAPLLQNRKLLHIVVYVLIAAVAIAIAATLTENLAFIVVVAVFMAMLVIMGVSVERKLDLPGVPAHA